MINWTCKKCNTVLDNADNAPEHTHEHAPEKVVCCGEAMSFELVDFDGPRKLDVVFDWPHQCWRKTDGSLIKEEDQGENWDFGCGKCSGPSEMTGFNDYYEHYSCLNCGNTFKVN